MSLILKGIDLPAKGEIIEISLYSDGEVYARRVSNWNEETNIPNIEAIPIPTPHGRLIDADDFIDVCEILADKTYDRGVFEQAEWIARDMRTILEAEE